MTAFAFYLLKVIICSGILFLYYLLALRNRSFHQWNRFYLLAAVVLSLSLPFMEFTIYNQLQPEKQKTIQLLQVVGDANYYLDEIVIGGNTSVSSDQWMIIAYVLVAVILFMILLHSLYRIAGIISTHQVHRVEKVKLIDTQVAGTPFSFFHFIFWNRAIDVQSENGRRIFEHELVHVREKHTLDKIFMQMVLVVFWINPFFWLMRRELKQIHEFIADQKSVGEHGAGAFAAMILQSAFTRQYNVITNSFFQTPIKRRIAMLSKNQKTSLNYFSRIAALFIVILTVLAFTVRNKNIMAPASIDKPLIVVIDAGHGQQDGKSTGAISNGIYEDDVVLAIAQKIKSLNTDKNIKVLLTRVGKENIALEDRVAFIKENKADLVISLHINAHSEDAGKSGLEIVLPTRNPDILGQSQLLGSAIHAELGSMFQTKGQLVIRNAGVYVLNSSPCPAVLVECGYLTNAGDLKLITNPRQQEIIASNILKAINSYASAFTTSGTAQKQVYDTLVPSKLSASNNNISNTQPKEIVVQGKKIESTQASDVVVADYKTETTRAVPGNVQASEIIVEGKPLTATVVSGYQRVDSLKEEPKIDKAVWRKFLEENLIHVIVEGAKKGVPAGMYIVQVKFFVDVDGSLSDFSIVKDPGHGFGDGVLALMHKSPKWTPAKINGKAVGSYFTQPITLVITE